MVVDGRTGCAQIGPARPVRAVARAAAVRRPSRRLGPSRLALSALIRTEQHRRALAVPPRGRVVLMSSTRCPYPQVIRRSLGSFRAVQTGMFPQFTAIFAPGSIPGSSTTEEAGQGVSPPWPSSFLGTFGHILTPGRPSCRLRRQGRRETGGRTDRGSSSPTCGQRAAREGWALHFADLDHRSGRSSGDTGTPAGEMAANIIISG